VVVAGRMALRPLSVAGARLMRMTERWALATAEGGGALLAPLGRDGLPAGPVLAEPDLVESVRSRPDVARTSRVIFSVRVGMASLNVLRRYFVTKTKWTCRLWTTWRPVLTSGPGSRRGDTNQC
jgi:hypothetical protein